MATQKRRNSLSIDFYGTSELLNKIEDAGGNLEDIIGGAVHESVQPAKNDMVSFMSKHRFTGLTESSIDETPLNWKNGQLKYRVGYNMKKGGIAALFLDVGTPKQKPYFFVHHAVETNIDRIKKAQEDALKEAFRELL